MGKLFYGTQTATTTGVAEQIQEHLKGLIAEVKCVHFADPGQLAACDFLVLGGATYDDGELTDDWKHFWPHMDSITFTDKKVPLFALGDQDGYSYTFVSAMRQFYDKVRAAGGEVIAAKIPTSGFDFHHSDSIRDGCFVGLVIDEVNQPKLTERRIKAWAVEVRRQLAAVCSV